jgi:hypothetical protein
MDFLSANGHPLIASMTPRVMGVALVLLLLSCAREHRVLEIQQQTELLQEPYPLNYPSTAPKQNSIIRVLTPQRVIIVSDSYEKDYHVYRVLDSQGNKGYIIDRPGVKEKREGAD